MSDSAVQIVNLLYRYAELLDGGDLAGTAALFRHARIRMAGGPDIDGSGLLAVWRQYVKIHADGTPCTKHLVSNPILDIDEAAGHARCRSYYTVLQAAPGLPLQVIAAGRYHDEFERIDGRWRFAARDYSMLDLKGNLAEHLLVPPPG
ncbi:MAG: nuclear transport factor 2 family protein [Nevskia sp.]|nr:nuclear transport factor 2 family protein [Nevskia sp.]